MPPRQSDQRRVSSSDRVRAATAELEELRREVSKGSGVLRSHSQQTLSLSQSSQVPLLVPRQDGAPVDSAIAFTDSGAQLRDPTDSEYRDLSLRGLDARGTVRAGGVSATGGVYSDFEIIAQSGIRSEFGISTPGDMVAAGRGSFNNVAITGNSIFSWDRDNALRWSTDTAFESCNRAGTEFRGVRCSRLAEVGATSWSWSKTDHQTLDDALGTTVGELIDRVAGSVTAWRHDPEVVPDVATGQRRVGLMLDDLPEVLIERNLIPQRVETATEVPVVDEDGRPTGRTVTEFGSTETGVMLDRSTWDLRGMVSLLLVEVASLRAELAARPV